MIHCIAVFWLNTGNDSETSKMFNRYLKKITPDSKSNLIGSSNCGYLVKHAFVYNHVL